MAFKFKIALSAQLHINDAIDWYESRQQDLGRRFYSDFDNSLFYIINNPYLFTVKSGNFRECRFAIFPYVIIYEIMQDTVVILAVFNTSKNPKKKPLT